MSARLPFVMSIIINRKPSFFIHVFLSGRNRFVGSLAHHVTFKLCKKPLYAKRLVHKSRILLLTFHESRLMEKFVTRGGEKDKFVDHVSRKGIGNF